MTRFEAFALCVLLFVVLYGAYLWAEAREQRRIRYPYRRVTSRTVRR